MQEKGMRESHIIKYAIFLKLGNLKMCGLNSQNSKASHRKTKNAEYLFLGYTKNSQDKTYCL